LVGITFIVNQILLSTFWCIFYFYVGRGVKESSAKNLCIVTKLFLGKKWTYNLKHGVLEGLLSQNKSKGSWASWSRGSFINFIGKVGTFNFTTKLF
jgi:hypothetical protein